ncbi:MAG: sodium-dependent bicarbonate transport family permease [Polymorphobacter sp.]|uniref:sodium-dependent bicarbonate transport family permease n=1 Tax=Polymorphobacter sp. TaxID=1909290 RepID=UPI003A842F4D
MDQSLAALGNPAVLFFLLGALAAFARSDLAVPDAVAKGLSIFLMMSIGLRGGVEVAHVGLGSAVATAAALGLGLSALLPFPAFLALRRIGRQDIVNAAAIAGHYGSVSVVTFVTGHDILIGRGLAPAGYMVAVVALMETPAIVSALLLANRARGPESPGSPLSDLLREVLVNGSVVLLAGSFVIGMIIGDAGFKPIAPLFDGLFKGALCLFLLDMGLVAARRLIDARLLTPALAALGVALPLVQGAIGVSIATALGFAPGTAAEFGILAASASYIAVPAAMRLALPAADPGRYLTMSLGITFPFNIIIGIALYTSLALALA